MSAIRWMFHTTAMVADYDVARDRLALLTGLRVLEYSENDLPGIGRRGGMCWIGDNSIELGQPTVKEGAAARFVANTGGGMHSVAVQVTDIDEAVAHVESCGVRVAARPMPEMFFTDPRDTCGVFIEWGAFEVHEDPHFGASPPPHIVEPMFDVERHAYLGAVVDDPSATADLLVRLFGTNVTFDDADAQPGQPRIGVSVGDCTLALFDMPGELSTSLWGAAIERPRTHLLAVSVPDLDSVGPLLDEHGFVVVRRTDSMVVIDPATCGGVQVALVDALLPGDPRVQPPR